MLRMDNLYATIGALRIFSGEANGFHWVFPALTIFSPGGGGMDRSRVTSCGEICSRAQKHPVSLSLDPLERNL
jgi:hypothetical protein